VYKGLIMSQLTSSRNVFFVHSKLRYWSSSFLSYNLEDPYPVLRLMHPLMKEIPSKFSMFKSFVPSVFHLLQPQILKFLSILLLHHIILEPQCYLHRASTSKKFSHVFNY